MESNPSTPQKKNRTAARQLLFALCLSLLFLTFSHGLMNPQEARANAPEPTPDGMEDSASSARLAEPPLTESPTQYEQGRYDYWMHCMPCHGDYGQGLTEEFIELWPPDHQGCWGRGCHGGRIEDEGFPIPKYIPAIIYPGGMSNFTDPEGLFEYLRATHPPQNPGVLEEGSYWAITSFVLAESDLIPVDQGIGPEAESEIWGIFLRAAVILLCLLALIIVAQIVKRRKAETRPDLSE